MLNRPCSALLLFTASILLLAVPLTARSRKHYGEGFSIDLDQPYDRVLQVIKAVMDDGIIRGTSEYKGSEDLYGAIPQTNCDMFRKPAEAGAVFYKVRSQTIAPEHFYNSNDQGTLAIRYVIRELGPKSTRLTIDAIFQEDNHHRFHASDGTVENAEFLAISDEIKDMEDNELKVRRDAAMAVEQDKISALQAELDQQNKQLKSLHTKEQELTKQVQARQRGKPGVVKAASADLKAQPYNQSRTLQSLSQGQSVAVLQQTRSWCLVQTSAGTEGWIYALMLQVNP